MRLIRSQLALTEALALSASTELTLSQLARAVQAPASAAQRALEILLEDGVAERAAENRSRYRLSATETAAHVVGLATCEIPLPQAVPIGARANPAIEFAARQNHVLFIVFAAGSTAAEQARAARFVEALARRHALDVQYADHDDVRRRLLSEPHLRQRMARAEILFGDLDRTLPDRSRHGLAHGQPLHHPHQALRLPPPSTVRAIARKYGVGSLKLFGSAVRTDFRPDSDVDVLIGYRPGVRPSLRSMIDLERALESAFGRDVDLVREDTLLPQAHQRVQREAVPLL